jgi:hypothetical protein
MSKRRNVIVQELDPETVDGITSAQKQYYRSLGFKPYLNSVGRIKWLRPEQHSLRINSGRKRNFVQRLFMPRIVQPPYRRKRRSRVLRFIRHYWPTVLIVLAITIAVLYVFINPEIFW